MMICGFLESVMACVTMSSPPVITAAARDAAAAQRRQTGLEPDWGAQRIKGVADAKRKLAASIANETYVTRRGHTPGRREHECEERAVPLCVEQCLQDGQCKGRSLAGARLRDANNVPPYASCLESRSGCTDAPCSAMGMASRWMGVGWLYPTAAQASHSAGSRPCQTRQGS